MGPLPPPTPELFDRILFRPLARPLVRLLVPTAVVPPNLTLAAVLCGLGAGVALAVPAPGAFALLIGLHLLLGATDDELARRRGGGDTWGRFADGLGDNLTAVCFHVGLAVWLVHLHGLAVGLTWTLLAAAGMGWRTWLLDTYRRRYRGDVDDLDAVREIQARRAERVRAALNAPQLPVTVEPRIRDQEAYRARLKPVLLLWLAIGPMTHYVLAAVLVAAHEPLLYVVVAAVPLSLVTLVALAWQRRLEARTPSVVERVPA